MGCVELLEVEGRGQQSEVCEHLGQIGLGPHGVRVRPIADVLVDPSPGMQTLESLVHPTGLAFRIQYRLIGSTPPDLHRDA
jgi:hypothetical protein